MQNATHQSRPPKRMMGRRLRRPSGRIGASLSDSHPNSMSFTAFQSMKTSCAL
jgi:hypothetical protein